MKIWLADLTYTQQTIASDVIPAAIGMIAEYAAAHVPEISEIRLFKYPEDLAMAFRAEQPDVMGFSNYVWNSALSLAFSREIKRDYPGVVVVMGGPNFATDSAEQEAFLRRNPWVDYYVTREAEHAFVMLLRGLAQANFDKGRLVPGLPNLVYLDVGGACYISPNSERILDLTLIPSPYLSGRLAEFFDGRLLPVIQTARGCPFTCTFCTEGLPYWNKVRHKSAEVIHDEIQYIAEQLARLPEDKRRSDLLIADSNFGMFQQDIDTCRVIADVQDRYNYPKYINVATGKNKKERVLEAARLVRGAMKFAGSVQSLDPAVQLNIKRNNISAEQIMELAMRSAEVGANSYSEVILALPGDSIDAHFRSLEMLVNAGFNTLAMYTLMMLTGTEMGSEESRLQYGMIIKYRVLPRCFGEYDFNDRAVRVAEIEEVCVGNNTLPFSDYLKCRRMNLIANIFYNDGVFSELLRLFGLLGVSPWGWLRRIYDSEVKGAFQELLDLFTAETESELWESREKLEESLQMPGQMQRYVDGEFGSNLIFKYKALSLTRYFSSTCDLALASAQSYLREMPHDFDDLPGLVEDVIAFKRMQVEGIFEDGASRARKFSFDVPRLAEIEGPSQIPSLRWPVAENLVFEHSADQRHTIESYTRIFGADVRGLTRILSRVYLKQLFRQPQTMSVVSHGGSILEQPS